jgi:hypothetical protein
MTTLPPYDALFESAWLKWGQAVLHSQTLEADIDAFGKQADAVGRFTVRTEYHPKRHGFAIYLASIDPIPVRWSLVLGDVANNYRSCLDHLAWAVVSRGRKPPSVLTARQQGNIYFPICSDRKVFTASLNGKLPGATRADIAIIRSYQPCQSDQRRRGNHVLTILTTINNGDKHRTLHPVWSVPLDAQYELTDQRDCVVPTQLGRAFRAPLEVDMELNFVTAKKMGPKPQIEVNAGMTFKPSVENLILVETWLHVAKQWIFLLLRQFSAPPDELLSIGLDFDRLRLGNDP